MDVTNIPNAAHWLNHSVVIVKEDYTAADEAWILNKLISIESSSVQITGKHKDILTVQRMVQAGSLVAVQRSNGRVKTVHLPQEAEELLWSDLQYILAEINKLNEPPMTKKEQEDFPTPVSEHLQANLRSVK